MGLIDLLLDNLFFVIIIIGFLFSTLGRKKKGSTEEEDSQPMSTSPSEATVQKEPSFEFPWEKVSRQDQERMESELAQERSGRNQYSWSDDESPIVHHPSIAKERVSSLENKIKASSDRFERRSGRSAIASSAIASSSIGEIGEIDGDLTNRRRSSASSTSASSLHPAKVDVDQAMQGMIWAQVFGKPRARDPHRSLLGRNRRHR